MAEKLISPDSENPWTSELTKEETDDIFENGNALCLNCVHPDSNPKWFCELCGNPTGHYSPYMPFVYLFWIGWLFRSAVDGSTELTKFRLFGLVTFSLVQYGIFAPLYLYRLCLAANGRYIQDKRIQRDEKEYSAPKEPFEYEKLSLSELMEVSGSIDCEAHPERFKKLVNEIEKRNKGERSS